MRIAVRLHAEDADRHLPLAAGTDRLDAPAGWSRRHESTGASARATRLPRWAVARSPPSPGGGATGTKPSCGCDEHWPRPSWWSRVAPPTVGPARPTVCRVDRLSGRRVPAEPPNAVPALLVAAIDCYDSELMGAHASFFAWGRRGRPQAASNRSRRVELRHRGSRYALDVSRIGPDPLPRAPRRRPRRRRPPPHGPVREPNGDRRTRLPCGLDDHRHAPRRRGRRRRPPLRARRRQRHPLPDAGRRRVGVAWRPATRSTSATRWPSSRA